MYMFGVVGEAHAHDYFEVTSFYNIAKIYNILRYVIAHVLRNVVCISKKLKYLKNEARESKTER